MDVPDLRPSSFGELLDSTFTYYRRHFWLFVAIMAVPQVIIVAIDIAWESFQRTALQNAAAAAPAMRGVLFYGSAVLGTIIVLLAYFAIYAVALGATTFAVSEIHLGRATTARAAYGRVRGRYWRLINLIGAVALRGYLVFILFMIAVVVLVAMAAIFAKSQGALVAVMVGLLALAVFFGGMFFAVRFVLRYACAVPAQLLENLKSGSAINRSIALTKKNLGRVFLLTLLMALVSYTVAAVLEGSFLVATLMTTLKSHTPAPFWLVLCMNITGGVGHAVTGPLLMIGLVLLYYDLRVRKEGFDLQVMMSALDAQAPLPGVPADSPAPAAPQLERANVALLVVLTVLTLGLYYPIWFMRRRSGINDLRSGEKLGLGVFVLVFVLWLADLVLNFGKDYLNVPGVHPGLGWLASFDGGTTLVIGVLLLIQAFKVGRILEAHTAGSSAEPFANSISLAQGSSLSRVATFFFGIFYLQLKINEMVESWTQGRPGVGTDVVPTV